MSNVFQEGFSGKVPENYDRYLGPVVFEPYAVDLADRLDMEPGMRVLEIAAGSGRVTRHLVSRLPADGKLIVTDISEAMLEKAQTEIRDSRITWQQADAQTLPFESGKFDAVVCQFGVMFFPERVDAYRETLRVLRPGGRFLFNTWGTLGDNPWADIVQEVMDREFQPDPPRFMHKPYSYSDEAEVRGDVEQAGFVGVHSQWLEFMGESPDARTFAQGVVEGTPLGGEIVRHGGDLGRCHELLAVAYAERLGASPMRTRLRALVAWGNRPSQ